MSGIMTKSTANLEESESCCAAKLDFTSGFKKKTSEYEWAVHRQMNIRRAGPCLSSITSPWRTDVLSRVYRCLTPSICIHSWDPIRIWCSTSQDYCRWTNKLHANNNSNNNSGRDDGARVTIQHSRCVHVGFFRVFRFSPTSMPRVDPLL